jgi:hypothetical protein
LSTKNYTPQDWLDEIEDGLEYRRRFGLEDKWAELEAIYYNVHESMMNDGPNIFLSQGDAMLSQLTVPTARIRVKPTTQEEVSKAPLVETLDNKLLSEGELPQEIDTAALHCYLFGRGIIKHGYDSEWGYTPGLDMGGQLQMGATLTQLNKKGDRRIEYDSTIYPGSPWSRAVLPHDFVVPWGTKELESAPWVVHRVVRHIDDLRADRKYTIPRDLKPHLSMEDFVNSYRTPQAKKLGRGSTHSGQNEATHVEFFEIHDRSTGKIMVVTWDCDKFLRKEDNALQIENRLPFSSMSFTPRTRSFWTTPDAYYLYYIQNELSDTAVQRTKQRRISTLKFMFDENVIDEEELQKALSPEVGIGIKVNGSAGDMSKALQPLTYAPNQQLAVEEDLLRANAREQLGMSRNQLGEYTGGRKTAREVGTVDRASQLRMSRRGLAVKRLYQDSIRTTNNIIFSYWTLPRYVDILGEANARKWVQINGPALRGRYNYDIEFVDEAELNERKLMALQLYGQLAKDPGVDPVALREWLSGQVNDPAFERIFSADIRQRMLELSALNGAIQSQSASGGQSNGGVRALQGADGQVSDPATNASRFLAGRGTGAGPYSG